MEFLILLHMTNFSTNLINDVIIMIIPLSSSSFCFFRNEGTPTAPSYVDHTSNAAVNPYFGSILANTHVALGDLDGDLSADWLISDCSETNADQLSGAYAGPFPLSITLSHVLAVSHAHASRLIHAISHSQRRTTRYGTAASYHRPTQYRGMLRARSLRARWYRERAQRIPAVYRTVQLGTFSAPHRMRALPAHEGNGAALLAQQVKARAAMHCRVGGGILTQLLELRLRHEACTAWHARKVHSLLPQDKPNAKRAAQAPSAL